MKRDDCSWWDVACHARALANAIVQAPAKLIEGAKELGTALVNTAVSAGTAVYDGLKSAVSVLCLSPIDVTS